MNKEPRNGLFMSPWGAKVVSELADYLKRMNPKRRGFGKRHLYNMVKFYDTYSTDEFNQLGKLLRLDEFVQSPIAQLDTPLINMPRILAFPTPEQITHYQEYATEKAMAVFIVLGVGGAPSMPEELYLIPLISISQIQSNPSSLKQYKRECTAEPTLLCS